MTDENPNNEPKALRRDYQQLHFDLAMGPDAWSDFLNGLESSFETAGITPSEFGEQLADIIEMLHKQTRQFPHGGPPPISEAMRDRLIEQIHEIADRHHLSLSPHLRLPNQDPNQT